MFLHKRNTKSILSIPGTKVLQGEEGGKSIAACLILCIKMLTAQETGIIY